MSNRFVERMRAIDPRYGTQRHQAAFVARTDELQRRAPCKTDHEHSAACYPEALVRQVADGVLG